MSNSPDFTPFALDRPPPVWMGCTNQEIQSLMLASATAGVVIGLLLWVLTGAWPAIFGAPVALIGMTLTAGAKRLAAAKRGLPHGYHLHQFILFLEQWFGVKAPFLHRSGSWSARRHV